jgi:hypothetical protein
LSVGYRERCKAAQAGFEAEAKKQVARNRLRLAAAIAGDPLRVPRDAHEFSADATFLAGVCAAPRARRSRSASAAALAFCGQGPAQAIRTDHWIDLPAFVVGTIVALDLAALAAGHRLDEDIRGLFAEILPALERYQFRHGFLLSFFLEVLPEP